MEKQLAVAQALNLVEKERDNLSNELAQIKKEKESAVALLEAKLQSELQKIAFEKESQIHELRSKLDASGVVLPQYVLYAH